MAIVVVSPAYAGGSGSQLPESFFGLVIGIIALVLVILIVCHHQYRTVRRKSAELRRELFERQMAEKELLASEQRLRQSLAEKESLLKEIHHRVKNNLQIVSSLLYLQEESTQDTSGLEILRESQNRIKSMALIHEQLYETTDLARIDFGTYTQGLIANLFNAYGIDPARIRLDIRAADIALGVDMAVPCGLIVNELVSNALKHAFPKDISGTIDIAIQYLEPDRINIVVADDGIGIPAAHTYAHKKTLGLRLVDTLVAQLEGRLAIRAENGTRFSITLKMPGRPKKEP
ncbi:MAG: histidine kinase dimerization/phosphoacceptor domain -containing protein [Desulfosarcina sp.]|jgi:two-component sensor histidine kinase